jgi:hypothetical protein
MIYVSELPRPAFLSTGFVAVPGFLILGGGFAIAYEPFQVISYGTDLFCLLHCSGVGGRVAGYLLKKGRAASLAVFAF